jgi:hypothetical protein
MPFQYTFRADDITTWEAETRDLVENRDRELELYSTTIDNSFLNLNASNLTLGTVPSARMTGAYTGITGLGTLTSLDVNGTATVRVAATQDGVALVGRAGGTSSYEVTLTPTTLTSDRTLTLPNVDGTLITTGNLSSITAVGTLTSLTTTGQVTMTRGALGTTAGNEIVFLDPNATTTNGDKVDTRLIRNSNGSDWTTAVWRIGRLVDSSRMGFIQFGNGAGGQDARLGVGSTTYATVNTGGLTIVGEIFASSNIRVSTAGANFIAQSPTTGAANAAQWSLAFGVYILIRNTSTRTDKENIQPLNGIVTPSMIDDIDISLWNRKNAKGFPEIGPMAEDMDDISPFLSIRGMDCDDEGNIVATDPTGINQNSWLSLLTLGIQDIRQRLQQLETA